MMTMGNAAELGDISPSLRKALRWAWAAATERDTSGTPPVEVEATDLLFGVLLAHAGERGEGHVLLAHFGLTARDVLPPGHSIPDPASLVRAAGQVPPDGLPDLTPDVESALSDVRSRIGGGTLHLRGLLAALLRNRRGSLATSMRDALTAAGASYDRLADELTELVAATKGSGLPNLTDMLIREFPRQPVHLPAFVSDHVARAGRDLIGIGTEVDAFAHLLASTDLVPPLAVGLFGDWGSGKSFMMSAVRGRVDELTALVGAKPQSTVRIWKHIRQIDFNAWQYVRGDLWASLLDHILGALATTDGQWVPRQRAQVSKELTQAHHDQIDRAKVVTQREIAVTQAHDALATAERERDKRQQELDDQEADEREQQLIQQAREALADVWQDQAPSVVGDDPVAMIDTIAETRSQIVRGRALLGPYWTGGRVTAATVAAFAVLAIVGVLQFVDVPPLASAVAGLATAVPVITAGLRAFATWSRTTLDKLDDAERKLSQHRAAQRAAINAPVVNARRTYEQARTHLEHARDAELAASAHVAKLRTTLAELSPANMLGTFVEERASSDDYSRHLGLLSTVRDDLRELEQLIAANNAAALQDKDSPQPNRIILYIDDLDRCPDDKVREVLEAVHLLLAFELFVVVVAVDTRWLTGALERQLPQLAVTNGAARSVTPRDYIEKIFQVPFQVTPLGTDARIDMVRGLLERSMRTEESVGSGNDDHDLRLNDTQRDALLAMASGGVGPRFDTQLVQLSREDLTTIESLSGFLGHTPRRVKRFVNVFQILCALPGREGASTRAAIALLAALHDGMPAVATTLFDTIRAGASGPLGTVVSDLSGVPDDDLQRVRSWLDEHPEVVGHPVDELTERVAMVRRMSFDMPTRQTEPVAATPA